MRRTLVLILLTLSLAFPIPARADVAPPGQPPGSNLEPGSASTQVRMAAETVLIEVQPARSSDSLGSARVTADFTMQNDGQTAEAMAVRFPIAANSGFSTYPEIHDLAVVVEGRNIPIRRTTGPDPVYGGEEVPWAEFDVTFPPGEDVDIRVTYTLEGTGEFPFITFYYILATGAGWKDVIGSAEIILRLPFEASPHNVILDTEIGWGTTTPGGVMSGHEVRWHFENLEPTSEDNFEVALVTPSVWLQMLAERDRLAANPNDGEAWGRLGKLYKDMFFLRRDFRRDVGGLELYALSVEAYERSVALLPQDALWHAGFAELLAYRAIFGAYTGEDVMPGLLRGLEEIHTALALAPDDPTVNQIADDFLYYLQYEPRFAGAITLTGDGYDFLWLTATPSEVPDTPVPGPTATPEPPASPTPAAVPVSSSQSTKEPAPASAGNPLCGAALLPLWLIFVLRRRR